MTEAHPKSRLPWGTILLAVGLGLTAVGLLHTREPPLPRATMLAAVGAVVAFFLSVRLLQNAFWGLVASVLLPIHPLISDLLSRIEAPAFLAECSNLVALVAVLLLAILAFAPQPGWKAWLVLSGLLTLVTAMTWACQPSVGLRASLLVGIGSLLLAALAVVQWSRHRSVALVNPLLAALLGPTAAIVGLLTAPLLAPVLPDQWSSERWQDLAANAVNALHTIDGHLFTVSQLQTWCWPSLWVAVPVLVYACWRSLRRGWKQCRRGQPPLTWLLTLFAALTLVGLSAESECDVPTVLITLNSLTVLLLVFVVADLWQGTYERLSLPPPHERQP